VIRTRRIARRPDERRWRAAYVAHQQKVARQALHLGSVRAARAALRVLAGEDFADPVDASGYLQTLRDRSSDDHEVLAAIERVISLLPDRPVSEETGRFLACEAMGLAASHSSETD
jgi:hypothetical protein